MENTSCAIFKKSTDWIRTHPRAMNLDVPDEFVLEWSFNEEEEEDPKPHGFYLSVFSFGFLLDQILSSDLPPTTPRSVGLSELLGHFASWQLKLGIAEVHRKTEVQFEPLPLFSFPANEQIRYWPKSQVTGSR